VIAAAATPDMPELIIFRRPRLNSGAGEGDLPTILKEIASSGQISLHFRQVIHSEWEVEKKSSPIAPMGQERTHRRHRVQRSETERRNRGLKEKKASIAPAGQRLRHQKRR
jgi:hypothetical protein